MTEFMNETNKLVQMINDIKTCYNINQIQELTGKQFKEVLFDTDICNWNRFNSTFDKRIFGKDQIVLNVTNRIKMAGKKKNTKTD